MCKRAAHVDAEAQRKFGVAAIAQIVTGSPQIVGRTCPFEAVIGKTRVVHQPLRVIWSALSVYQTDVVARFI